MIPLILLSIDKYDLHVDCLSKWKAPEPRSTHSAAILRAILANQLQTEESHTIPERSQN